jgi:hypothetical protein
MAEDFTQWVPKQDAAEALGDSDRTLERKILKLKLRTTQRDVPGRRSITVLHPTDFERLKKMMIPASPSPSEREEEGKEVAFRPVLPARALTTCSTPSLYDKVAA